MKISLNTIKQIVDFDIPSVDTLVPRLNQQLGGVENVTELSDKYKGAVIVRVVRVEKHPNADRLSVCHVDDGGAVKDVDRDEDGLVQVVCGAPNVTDGMLAVWLPPNATVPSINAYSVWSLPTPTLRPGCTRVPRWRTMIEPAGTTSPP